MAKTSQAALIWSQEDQHYLWRDEQDTETLEGDEKPEAWQRRLVASTSFSFQGREGHLTLLKEGRPRGREGYWYAYRRQGKRTVKKYAGRTAAPGHRAGAHSAGQAPAYGWMGGRGSGNARRGGTRLLPFRPPGQANWRRRRTVGAAHPTSCSAQGIAQRMFPLRRWR